MQSQEIIMNIRYPLNSDFVFVLSAAPYAGLVLIAGEQSYQTRFWNDVFCA
jgi:hypothetical protein